MLNLLDFFSYEDFVKNPEVISDFVSVEVYREIMNETSDFLNHHSLKVDDIKISSDTEGQVVVMFLSIDINPTFAASLSWDMTEEIVTKDLDNRGFIISLVGTRLKGA